MKTLVCVAALIVSDFGLSAQAETSALPSGPKPPTHGLVPGLGSTPGNIVILQSPAAKCSRDAARAADGLMTPTDAIATCNDAILTDAATRRDLGANLVNRGVLLMTMKRKGEAKLDFERALALDPSLAEAHVNLGVILLDEGKTRDALAALDRGIALGPEWPERAYYHRGIAREDLKDIRGAYADYKAAEALKPGWEPVTTELSRFKVVKSSTTN